MWSSIKVRVDFWRGGIVCKWWACLCASGTGGGALLFGGDITTGAGAGAGVDLDAGVVLLLLRTARDRQIHNPQSTINASTTRASYWSYLAEARSRPGPPQRVCCDTDTDAGTRTGTGTAAERGEREKSAQT